MTDGNDAAYPETRKKDNAYSAEGGLTKREYFAALAMQGICSSETEGWPDLSEQGIAARAVLLADALIDELNDSIIKDPDLENKRETPQLANGIGVSPLEPPASIV
jgi:hypothetical protein